MNISLFRTKLASVTIENKLCSDLLRKTRALFNESGDGIRNGGFSAAGLRAEPCLKRRHQASGGGRVFAAGKYGKAGSRGAGGSAPNPSIPAGNRTPTFRTGI